jgi:hypothetical protein
LKFGTYVYKRERTAGFDFHVLRVKLETGDRIPPEQEMYSNIAVFADTAITREHPDWISQSPFGPARIGNNNFNIYWNVVCATQPDYRAEQLDYIEDVDRHSPGVWLNSQYFADHGHCTCSRCRKLWKESGLSWLEWRRKEVTDYISQVRERVKKELVMCIQPDPVTAYERYGVNFDDLAKYADAFNVVMFSKSYATPWYWEMLARAFKKLLQKPVYISLYVLGPGDSAKDVPSASELLTVSVRCARTGVDGILYLANGASQIRDFQKAAVDKVALRNRLNSYGNRSVQEILDLIKSWEKIVG